MNYGKIIGNDRSYRNNELSFLKDILLQFKDQEGEKTVIRSGILLLYAHREGFCKKNSENYVKYIKEKKIPIEKIDNTILINNIFSEKGKVNFMKIWILKHFFKQKITSKELKIEISTENNLKYTTLKDKILPKIGIKQNDIERKFQANLLLTDLSKLDFIDKGKLLKYLILDKTGSVSEYNFDSLDNYLVNTLKILLHYRNEIGHGSADLCLTYNQFLFMYETIRTLILSYKEVLLDYIK